MNSLLDRFEEIWVVDFEYQSTDGELPVIHCMVAREVHSLRLIRLFEDELSSLEKPPFEIGERSLVVGFYLPAEYGCFLQLGWNRPINSLDLYTEFRWLRNGIKDGKGRGLVDALSYFGLDDSIPDEKGEWRTLAIRGGPFSENERSGLLAYCQQDVDATVKLLAEMIFPHPVDPGKRERSLQHALLRGHYSWAVAAIERTGVLIDTETLGRLMQNWEILKLRMITRIDTEGVYVDGKFNTKRFETFLAKNKIPWPRLETGRLSLTDDTFREQARSHPTLIAPYHELRSSLSKLRLNKLAVGRDGRNRVMLSPFGSTTGRNQPSTTRFIFGPSTWIRCLIKPGPGRFVAYIDWSQQELGIAACLSGDAKMVAAYQSGDPYLEFAKMAGAVPDAATKVSHPDKRSLYKKCMLAVQYGMAAKSLAEQIGEIYPVGKHLLQKHRDTFPVYWAWSEKIQNTGFGTGILETSLGWRRRVMADDKPASVRNFPVQANGAEMLRLAIMFLQDDGIDVCAPVHDAVVIEGPLERQEEIVSRAQKLMRRASEIILPNLPLESDVKVVQYPNRFYDEDRGKTFWEELMKELKSVETLARAGNKDTLIRQ